MIQSTAQAAQAQAVAQYAQNQAQSDRTQGAFSTALQTAMTQDGEGVEGQDSVQKESGASIFKDLAPLLLSGVSQDGGGMLLILMLALCMGKKNGGFSDELGGLLGSQSASGMNGLGSLAGIGGSASLGGLGGLMGAGSFSGSGTDSLLGGGNPFSTGGADGGLGGSAASQASMAAAQSLFNAYKGTQAGAQELPRAQAAIGSASTPGRQVTPALMSATGARNAGLYRSVIDQFNVENNPRYAVNQKGTGDTYCNIFLWDVTSAMGAEIPHYTDRETGAPVARGTEGALSMNANRMSDWLNTQGPQYGWHEVTAEQAQALANRGSPAVAVWKNREGGHGHVQVVSPSKDGAYDPGKGVAIAQAGRLLHNYTYIRNIYSSRMSEVQYFAHR